MKEEVTTLGSVDTIYVLLVIIRIHDFINSKKSFLLHLQIIWTCVFLFYFYFFKFHILV